MHLAGFLGLNHLRLCKKYIFLYLCILQLNSMLIDKICFVIFKYPIELNKNLTINLQLVTFLFKVFSILKNRQGFFRGPKIRKY